MGRARVHRRTVKTTQIYGVWGSFPTAVLSTLNVPADNDRGGEASERLSLLLTALPTDAGSGLPNRKTVSKTKRGRRLPRNGCRRQ